MAERSIPMRAALLILVLVPLLARGDNDYHFAQAIKSGKVHRIDRHMKRFIHREGKEVRASSYLHVLGGAEDRIGALYYSLRGQIGIIQLDWDRCVPKPAIWPGTWTLGVVYRTQDGLADQVLERCYVIQGGRPGRINLFGWRPRIRKARNDLRVIDVRSCPGYVEEQERICKERS